MTIRMAGKSGFSHPVHKLLYENELTGLGEFDVTGIPPSFSDLWLILRARSDFAAASIDAFIFYNGDLTAANYRFSVHSGGSSHTVGVGDDSDIVQVPGSTATAGYFGYYHIHIFEYANTSRNKTAWSMGGRRTGAADIEARQYVVHWENNSAINQIQVRSFNHATNQLIAGSQLRIFGLY